MDMRESGKLVKKKNLAAPDWDMISDIPVVDSPVYCGSDSLDHSAPKAAQRFTNPSGYTLKLRDRSLVLSKFNELVN
uniref:Uncharacterized protein n=1 Tax=Timema bartmani TaxID=61472 RepID=A0A7R9F420_9NEOP|nr:unnamed protein product [Timema bartmani]